MTDNDMHNWSTAISKVISTDEEEEIILRGQRMSELIGKASFSQVMFLLLKGDMPSASEARLLDAILVASIDHGIAPPSMIARCYASYGTSIQAAMAGGIMAFGDIMGGAGEALARLLSARLTPLGGLEAKLDEAGFAALAEETVANERASGRRIDGYGIPLHGTDPRAPGLMAVAREESLHGPHCRLADAIGDALARQAGKIIPMNLDGVIAALILDMGFPWQSARAFLITPRSVSMAAHYLEEQAQGTRWRHIPDEHIDYTGKMPA